MTSEPAKTTPATEPTGTAAAESGVKRYFEFVEGTSSKFWEISVSGSDVTVRFGRIGSNGQTKTKSFADESAAREHADSLIEEKVGKGYTEGR
ncbi:MAG: WGR domain-containing protein [Deltaproteobacteria bacterium]